MPLYLRARRTDGEMDLVGRRSYAPEKAVWQFGICKAVVVAWDKRVKGSWLGIYIGLWSRADGCRDRSCILRLVLLSADRLA